MEEKSRKNWAALLAGIVACSDLTGTEGLASSWIDRAVIYGVAPWYASQSEGKRFRDLQSRLPELADLGINTLWIQPVFQNHGRGQAYDVTDYFAIWPELGSEQDLRELVKSAHSRGIRVILDFVPNHVSVHHPFAQDAIQNGSSSPFYGFFMHSKDESPYSQHYQTRRLGSSDFIYYFWDELLNLDYNAAEVQDHILSAVKHWVAALDIDGYRFDASWGPLARAPEFFLRLRKELNAIKPEFLILAEDKAPHPEAYGERPLPCAGEAFDVAYDWTPSAAYVSEWAWQRGEQHQTVFNAVPAGQRASEVRRSLESLARDQHGERHASGFRGRTLRYLENNDTPRFLENHSPAQARLAAALMMSVPGVPLLYYGQEVGTLEKYPAYPESGPLRASDRQGFWNYYKRLLALRTSRPEWINGTWSETRVQPAARAADVFAFRRELAGKGSWIVLNLSDKSQTVRLELTSPQAILETITDISKDQRSQVAVEAVRSKGIALKPWSVHVLLER